MPKWNQRILQGMVLLLEWQLQLLLWVSLLGSKKNVICEQNV